MLNCEIVGMRDRLDLCSSVPSYDTFNFGFGNEPFVENGCEWTNCFATKDRTALPVDEFDAIIIHIRYMVTILITQFAYQNLSKKFSVLGPPSKFTS